MKLSPGFPRCPRRTGAGRSAKDTYRPSRAARQRRSQAASRGRLPPHLCRRPGSRRLQDRPWPLSRRLTPANTYGMLVIPRHRALANGEVCMIPLEWEKPRWRWSKTMSAVKMILMVLLYFTISPANADQLFTVDNYACGTTEDWESSELSYGESISVKDVELSYDTSTEIFQIGGEVSFTVTNKKSARLPAHIHWIVRSELNGNLAVIGAASRDFELKLMKPGDNRFKMALSSHLITKLDANKEHYGCLSVAYEE